MTKDIKILFSNRHEIRMGSPYMLADLEIQGIDINIPKNGWQDKFAISKDKKIIVLVNLDLTNNEPGFKFYFINTKTKKVGQSKRIRGLVNSLQIDGTTVMFNKFLFDKSKSKPGELCCNMNDQFLLNKNTTANIY